MSDARPVDLARRRFGRGPALAFLHGLFGSGRNWQSIARRFADRFTCLLPDLRNHGDSPWAEPMSYPAMAADVAAMLSAEGFERASLVGHSMGGKVAMLLALEAPQRVDRLVVVDIAPVRYTHSHRDLVERLLALDLSSITRRSEADAALEAAVPDPQLRAFLLQNLTVDEHGQARWRPNLELLHRAMPELTGFPALPPQARYEGPALFVRGGESDYVRDEHYPVIARLFPAARVETIPGAGHWLHAERPAELLQRLDEFLS